MKLFPIFLNVQGRSIVIFGGGEEAAAKLRLVQKTEARLFVVAEQVDESVLELGHAIWVRCAPQQFDLPRDLAMAYAATGDPQLDAALAQKVRDHGAICCAVDQMQASDFATPAIVDRDPVIVAVGTEGSAPVLARKIKADVEELLEPKLGQLARVAASLRDTVNQILVPGKLRRTFWRKFFETARAQPDHAAGIARGLLNQMSDNHATLNLADTLLGQADAVPADLRRALDDADVIVGAGGLSKTLRERCRREATLCEADEAGLALVEKAFRDSQNVLMFHPIGKWPEIVALASRYEVEPILHQNPSISASRILPMPNRQFSRHKLTPQPQVVSCQIQ